MMILHDIMRTEIPAPSFRWPWKFWDWFLDGIAIFIPESFKQIGWRPRYLLVERRDEEASLSSLVEQSFFGLYRKSAVKNASSLPSRIALSPAEVFTTRVSLPREASTSLEKTVALRLPDISPIPPEDAVFALGSVTHPERERLLVEIALARKGTLKAVEECHQDDEIETIGAAPDSYGVLKFCFKRTHSQRSRFNRRLAPLALFLAGAAGLSLAIDAQLARRINALEAYETDIRQELAALRPAVSLFETLDETTLSAAGVNLDISSLSLLNQTLNLLPKGAIIETITTDAANIEISGFVPIGATIDPSLEGAWTKASSNRPGYERFNLRLTRPETL